LGEPWNWTCNFCQVVQTVTDSNSATEDWGIATMGSLHGRVAMRVVSIACSNPECRELVIHTTLHKTVLRSGNRYLENEILAIVGNIPKSYLRLQPDFIPLAIKSDYYEACSIVDLSPKASATLSRRCIQGIIRDFCAISKPRLVEEIRELRKQVDAGTAPRGVEADVIDAIDAIREIGNIGAHMEKDINVIIDVDPDEAQTLIELIELLFSEWYVARHDRLQRIASISAIAQAKKDQKALPPPEK
jgi:hypothetical protein